MLYLTRKVGEAVIINNDIEVTVVEVRGKSIKLGFTFPPEASVLRKELHERIKAENIAAAQGGADLIDAGLIDKGLIDKGLPDKGLPARDAKPED